MSLKPTSPLTQAVNDVLAKMMQAEVNGGGPPPATPCDTPAEVISQTHMVDPENATPESEDTVPLTKTEFEKTLTDQLDRLHDEIREMGHKSATLKDAAAAKWHDTKADLEAKQKAARAKLGEVTHSTGAAWEHLRDGAKIAWTELEQAVRKARSEF